MTAQPEGTGKSQLDAPEGSAILGNRVFVVDTANHRIVAFDTETLAKVGQYPPDEWNASRGGRRWDQMSCPTDVAAHDGELFVTDTHNDRIQVRPGHTQPGMASTTAAPALPCIPAWAVTTHAPASGLHVQS